MIKVGDKYICVDSFNGVFTVGKEYSVIKLEFSLFHNDYKVYFRGQMSNGWISSYCFFLDMSHKYYMGNFFKNIRDIRYEKLESLYGRSRANINK